MATATPWNSLAGRSAGDINFENTVRQWQAKTDARLQNPGLPDVAVAPGWDAFFGGLQRTKDTAAANGQGFGVNWSGFGNQGDGSMMPSYYSPEGTARANALNQQLSDEALKFHLGQAAVAQANARASAEQDAGMQQYVDRDALSRAFAPGLTRDQSLAAAGPMAPTVSQIYAQRDAQKSELSDKAIMAQAALEKAGSKGSQDPNAPMAIPGVDPTKTGEAAIANAPLPIQNTIRALASGKQPWPSSMAMKTPYWQGLTAAVQQFDPSFDTAMASNNARVKTRVDFTTGKSAQQINAINTVVGHISQLSDAADSLGNGSSETLNAAKNWLAPGGSATGVAKGNFNVLRTGVGDELERVWRGAGGSEKDIEAWKQSIGDAKSPAQLHAAFATIGGMLQSKLDSLGEQYGQGLGTDKINMISPESATSLAKLQGRAKPAAESAPAAPSAPAPAAPAAPSGDGLSVTAPNGKVYRFTSAAQANGFRQRAGIK